jgi:cystathionine beta-lyase
MKDRIERDEATRLVHLGRDPKTQAGAVNPPLYRTSSLLFESVADFEAAQGRRYDKGTLYYGRYGTPTTFALEEAVAELEGGFGAVAVSSGLAAITAALLAYVSTGDHILVTDTAYYPTRLFCDRVLARLGVETSYYDPLIGEEIADLIGPRTRLIYLESPGSLTFEVQDTPLIARLAKAARLTVIHDGTWATPLYFKPFDKGVDVSIQAATKYLAGHSDVMAGLVVAADEAHYLSLRHLTTALGHAAPSEESYLVLRGLRTLAVRLARHQENALKVARWLAGRPEVARVLYPALPEDPGHHLWKRDFTGASGLFSIVLRAAPRDAMTAFIDALTLFPIGASWGGYESIVEPAYPERIRTARPWSAEGPTVRFHIGLEDPLDLIADLEAAFEVFARTSATAVTTKENAP